MLCGAVLCVVWCGVTCVMRAQPVVNEDPNAKIIRALRAEIEELQRKLASSGTTQQQSAEVMH